MSASARAQLYVLQYKARMPPWLRLALIAQPQSLNLWLALRSLQWTLASRVSPVQSRSGVLVAGKTPILTHWVHENPDPNPQRQSVNSPPKL